MRQAMGWKSGLHGRPKQARHFYVTTAGFTAIAMGLNFLGFNPMKALVWSGIVQGFSTPPLMLLILLMTNNRGADGQAGEQPPDQRARLDHRCGNLFSEPGARGHLVYLSQPTDSRAAPRVRAAV